MPSRVLLIGSGKDASQIRGWDLRGWTVAAINNAWSACIPSLRYHIFSGDWKPGAGNRPPPCLYDRVTRVSYREYDGEEQRRRFGRQSVGIGATMLWNAAYWCLGNLNPDVMGFVGCSMHYPAGGADTFYGESTPDPLRFPRETLEKWYMLFEEAAEGKGCDLVNFGRPGLIPYPRKEWADLVPAT